MVPMSSTAKMAGMEMKMTFDEVTFDQVEKDAFELPATIQTLLESKTGKDGV
jgi:hypothetical protein